MSISPSKLEEMSSSDMDKLKKNHNKDQLVAYIQTLRSKVEELVSYQLVSKRVELLERSHLNSLQYQRRESIEIHGIPQSIADDNLESYCTDVLEEIGCGEIESNDVHACHRLKNRDKTVIRFVNRKHADLALHNRKKLASIDKKKHQIPSQSPGLFINESLCRPMQFLEYKVRMAYKRKLIKSYNLWKGKLSLMLNEKKHFISHIDDLIILNLAEEDERVC